MKLMKNMRFRGCGSYEKSFMVFMFLMVQSKL